MDTVDLSAIVYWKTGWAKFCIYKGLIVRVGLWLYVWRKKLNLSDGANVKIDKGTLSNYNQLKSCSNPLNTV